MNGDRRQFNLALTSALLGLSAGPQLLAQTSAEHPSASSSAAHAPYFFKHPTFEIIFLTSLGLAYVATHKPKTDASVMQGVSAPPAAAPKPAGDVPQPADAPKPAAAPAVPKSNEVPK